MKNELYDKLIEYSENGRIPFHMPGHKRNIKFGEYLPYSLDITEIDGFDNLHDMHGILRKLSDNMAELWKTDYAFPLVSGSTGGILAAVRTLTERGDSVIMDRRCHKSVYNAVDICGLLPYYVCGKTDTEFDLPLPPSVSEIKDALSIHPETSLVVITSPTYEGYIADIPAISDIVHSFGAKLLVDQAHGAHLGLSDFFGGSSVGYADITVISLHKTLPALTQAAALLVSETIDPLRVAANLSVFETSSPSYVILASIDRCVGLLSENADSLFEKYNADLSNFYGRVSSLKYLKILDNKFHDRSKIVVSCQNTDIDGTKLAGLLRKKYNIEPEMIMPHYLLALSTVGDSGENLAALADALIEIDSSLSYERKDGNNYFSLKIPDQALALPDIKDRIGTYSLFSESVGKISLDYVYAYPPGAPLIVPGEIISSELTEYLNFLVTCGIGVSSMYANFPQMLVMNNRKSIDNTKKT